MWVGSSSIQFHFIPVSILALSILSFNVSIYQGISCSSTPLAGGPVAAPSSWAPCWSGPLRVLLASGTSSTWPESHPGRWPFGWSPHHPEITWRHWSSVSRVGTRVRDGIAAWRTYPRKATVSRYINKFHIYFHHGPLWFYDKFHLTSTLPLPEPYTPTPDPNPNSTFVSRW